MASREKIGEQSANEKITNEKIVVVTGGARRLGRAMAIEFARAGVSVAITYNHSEREARQTTEEMRAVAPDAERAYFGAHRVELTDTARLSELLPEILREAERPVWALVNNAAIFRSTPFAEMTEQDFDDHIATNLKAPYLLCKAFGDYFLGQGGGNILNIADVHGTRPLKNYVPYCVSKAGVIMLTEALALALAPTVRVNCLCPGTMLPPSEPQGETESENVTEDRADAAKLRSIPLGRIGTPQEVAEAARFLVFGPEYLTGAVLALDGGRRLR